MLEQTSTEFKQFFLLELTRELIKQSKTKEIFELEQKIIEEKEKPEPLQEIVKTKIKEINKGREEKGNLFDFPRTLEKHEQKKELFLKPSLPIKRKPLPPLLRIPKQQLPPRLQYIKPIPRETQINLGKINPLIKDPMVKSIECNGPNEKVIVNTSIGRKNSKIILNKQEIEGIIQTFSQTAKIPIQEGIFRVAVGRLTLSTIISEVVDPKFIIKKISSMPTTPPRFQRRF